MGSLPLFHGIFVLAACWLAPKDALAWGPVVHLDAATQVLLGTVAVAPAVLELLKRHALDFLYGAVAADFVIGKHHAKEHEHCHNWDVARELLRISRTQGSHREAFMLGYVNHLGADVVAHNHIVPHLMLQHYRSRRGGHLYWEARADHRVSQIVPELRNVWRELSMVRFPGHDLFLRQNVAPVIMSHAISQRLYKSNLQFQRHAIWRRTLGRIDEKSKLVLGQRELQLWRRLAAQAGARAVDNPWSRRLDHLDPTGRAALETAKASLKMLRRELRSGGEGEVLEGLWRTALVRAETVDLNHFEDDWV